MPMITKVRQLGSSGIITDVAPYELEAAGVFSRGKNVRFRNGKLVRGPMARTIATLPYNPGHVLTIPPAAGGDDEIIVISEDFGSFGRVNGKTVVDISPPDHAGAPSEARITSTFLGGISYVNCETHKPLYKRSSENTYLPLSTWPETWTAQVIRSYRDSLVALGVTQDGVYYPTKVVWSEPVQIDELPSSFSATTENSAGESTSNSMQHKIIDGLELRETFVIYTTDSVWAMDYIGGEFLYQWRKIWDERGAISANCVAQVGGRHFVFDRNDIWVHDGSSDQSIADGRVRDRIFRSLDYNLAHLCFVTTDPTLSEVRFCYPSKDDLVAYENPVNGCNRQAVYNYANQTWTFDDLPNVTDATRSTIKVGTSWDDLEAAGTSWDQMQGTWMTNQGSDDRHTIFVGASFPEQGLTAPRVYGFDSLTGGRLPIDVEPEAAKPAFVERIGIDLDAQGKTLAQMARLQRVWPQGRIDNPVDTKWSFGANDMVVDAPLYDAGHIWDPQESAKIYLNSTGHYLAWKFECEGISDFEISGFDVEFNVRGNR